MATVLATVINGERANAAACPLTIVGFNVYGLGLPQHSTQYRIVLLVDSPGTYSVTFHVIGLPVDDGRLVQLPNEKIDSDAPDLASFAFTWRADTLSKIEIDSVNGPDGRIVECDSTIAKTINRDVDWPLVAVNDANISFAGDAIASRIPNTGTMGLVVVKVTISQAGALNSATVYRSSGNPILDAAAVRSATNSTYAKGRPGDYLIKYAFVVK